MEITLAQRFNRPDARILTFLYMLVGNSCPHIVPGSAQTSGLAFYACGVLVQPNTEAGLAMRTGSAELTKLPDWPPNVSVFPVAGRIHRITNIFYSSIDLGAIDIGDGLVRSDSALKYEGRIKPAPSSFTAKCSVDLFAMVSDLLNFRSCTHGGLLFDAQVHDQIVKVMDG
jgi:hypothetical protein